MSCKDNFDNCENVSDKIHTILRTDVDINNSLSNNEKLYNITNYCKTNTDIGVNTFGNSLNYGSPMCGSFGILNKPKINEWYGRGNIVSVNPSGEFFKDGKNKKILEQTKDIPGGLANTEDDLDNVFTADDNIDKFSSTKEEINKKNSSFFGNGFIMNDCECSLLDKDYKSGAEIWYGHEFCRSYIDTNMCQSYLEKYAKSCKWCKDVNDMNLTCSFNEDCPSKICENGKCKPLSCKICDSSLWKYVPGGYEAVVDTKHRLHNIAKTSYTDHRNTSKSKMHTEILPVPTSIKHRGDFNDNYTFINRDSTRNYSNFCDSGPWEPRKGRLLKLPAVFSRYDNENNKCINLCNNSMECPYQPKNAGNDSKCIAKEISGAVDNTEIINVKFKGTDCESSGLYSLGGRDIISRNTYDSFKLMCKRNPEITGYFLDFGNNESVNSQDNIDKINTESNKYAANWINWKYEIFSSEDFKIVPNDTANKFGFTNDELKQHTIEHLRCCLGLDPVYKNHDGYSSRQHRNQCMPATMCPSSKFCESIYTQLLNGNDINGLKINQTTKFSESYPDNYNQDGKDTVTDKIVYKQEMEDVTNYARMYCNIVGGGTNNTKQRLDENRGNELKNHSTNIESLCRKNMFNSLAEPVNLKVEDKNKGLSSEEYKLPIRIFGKNAYKWCRGEMINAMPNQNGVCDMMLGKSCQQLQVDGWINPDNWNKSPLLTIFGKETNEKDENNDTIRTINEYDDDGNIRLKHKLSGIDLRRACGCFLLGSECGDDHCSYYYCGAGTKYATYPSNIPFSSDTNEPNVDTILNKQELLNPYGKKGILKKWSIGSSMTKPNFSCVKKEITGENTSTISSDCFKGCNYVNSYDTCWNAGPESRLIKIEDSENEYNIKWKCGNNTSYDNCNY